MTRKNKTKASYLVFRFRDEDEGFFFKEHCSRNLQLYNSVIMRHWSRFVSVIIYTEFLTDSTEDHVRRIIRRATPEALKKDSFIGFELVSRDF